MTTPLLASLLSTLAMIAGATPARAQDVVTLHGVTIDAGNNVTVVYSKNFATCAHLRFSNATCTQNGPLTHVNNIFCTPGNQVTVTVPSTAFVAGFGPGIPVYMVHGNNAGVFSTCVNVGCNGSYGSGCAGSAGTPALTANDDCPPSGSTLDLTIGNGVPGSIAVLGFGLGQTSFPLLGCNLLITTIVGTVTVPFSASGTGTFAFPLPIGSGGASFTTQAFTLDGGGPQGFAATNGLLLRVL